MVSVLATLGFGALAWRLSRPLSLKPTNASVLGKLLLMPLLVIVIFAMIRSTLDHHPVNPSTVAFSTDSMVNQLALNSPYTLVYAIYEQNRDSKRVSGTYGKMDDSEVLRIVTETAGLAGKVNLQSDTPSMHQQTASRRLDKPMNLVIILKEALAPSLSAALAAKT